MAHLIVCITGILYSSFLLIFSQQFPKSTKPNVPSAAFFPRIIGIILLGLSIYNVVAWLLARKQQMQEEQVESVKAGIAKGKTLQMVQIIALIVAYAVLWHFHLGHFLLNSTIIFFPLVMLLSDEKKWYYNAIFTVVLVAFIYVLFTVVLKVRLR